MAEVKCPWWCSDKVNQQKKKKTLAFWYYCETVNHSLSFTKPDLLCGHFLLGIAKWDAHEESAPSLWLLLNVTRTIHSQAHWGEWPKEKSMQEVPQITATKHDWLFTFSYPFVLLPLSHLQECISVASIKQVLEKGERVWQKKCWHRYGGGVCANGGFWTHQFIFQQHAFSNRASTAAQPLRWLHCYGDSCLSGCWESKHAMWPV